MCRDISLATESIPRNELDVLFDNVDCYVSPHRAEGLGLTIIEAMHAKKAVMATGFGGNTDFMREDNSELLDFRLIPVGKNAAPYPEHALWADPDLEGLKTRLVRAVTRGRSRPDQGRRAARSVRSLFGVEPAAQGVRDEMERILAAL